MDHLLSKDFLGKSRPAVRSTRSTGGPRTDRLAPDRRGRVGPVLARLESAVIAAGSPRGFVADRCAIAETIGPTVRSPSVDEPIGAVAPRSDVATVVDASSGRRRRPGPTRRRRLREASRSASWLDAARVRRSTVPRPAGRGTGRLGRPRPLAGGRARRGPRPASCRRCSLTIRWFGHASKSTKASDSVTWHQFQSISTNVDPLGSTRAGPDASQRGPHQGIVTLRSGGARVARRPGRGTDRGT